MKGGYLKEIAVSFILKEKVNTDKGVVFIKRLVEKIKMNLISLQVNSLPPGWTILGGLSESHIVLSYWGELDFMRLYLFSCKNFNQYQVLKEIRNFFKIKRKIKLEIIKKRKTLDEVKELCQKKLGN